MHRRSSASAAEVGACSSVSSRSDIVLFFMNDHGAHYLGNGSRVTLRGPGQRRGGPVRAQRRSRPLSPKLKAEIYSYAKSKGLFAGLSLDGAALTPDKDDNSDYYGNGVTYMQLLFGGGPATVPAEAQTFRQALP